MSHHSFSANSYAYSSLTSSSGSSGGYGGGYSSSYSSSEGCGGSDKGFYLGLTAFLTPMVGIFFVPEKYGMLLALTSPITMLASYLVLNTVTNATTAAYNYVDKKITKYQDRVNLKSSKSLKDFEVWKTNHEYVTKPKSNRTIVNNLNITNSVLDKIKKYRTEIIDSDTTMFTQDKDNGNSIKSKDSKNKFV